MEHGQPSPRPDTPSGAEQAPGPPKTTDDGPPAAGPGDVVQDPIHTSQDRGGGPDLPDDASGDGRAEQEAGLTHYLLREVGPRFMEPLRNRFENAIRRDELPGIIDPAAAKMLAAQDADNLPKAELAPLFYTYCLHVAQEFVSSAWNRQRQQERSMPTEELDRLARAVELPPGNDDDGQHGRPSRQTLLVYAALATLSHRDRMILEADASHPQGKLPGSDWAAALGLTTKGARRARSRAKERFKQAYLRLAAQETSNRDGEASAANGGE